MRILLSTTQVPFIEGGAETHARSLAEALQARGHDVDMVRIPFKWYPPERIHEHLLATRLLDVTESNGTPIDLVIGLKFPAYHIRHPNKVMWVIHQHRTAFEMWQSELCDLSPFPAGKSVRDSIEQVERKLFPEARRVFSNCRNVGDRLKRFCGIDSTPLYHPPQNVDAFYNAPAEDFLYFPSRLNPWKRQHLAIEAVRLTRKPVRLILSGAADHPEYEQRLRTLITEYKLESRVELRGRIPFDEMLGLYARCKAVVFPPDNEDYGYITLEAMLAAKPVLTCSDSGGPVEFLRNGTDGLVVQPDPQALADCMDEAWSSPSFSCELGANARQRYDDLNISWNYVVDQLLQ